MKKICVISDFDGTITEKDTLYTFFQTYATKGWLDVEADWVNGRINSKECLIKEFELVPNLNEQLIQKFLDSVKIDEYFPEFYSLIKTKNIDFYIVSDGVDYFINKILTKNNLTEIKVISNHGEFNASGKLELSFPNSFQACQKDSGTCKCKVLNELKEKYEKTIYIGDGVSDYCVAGKSDYLFAKAKLINYCRKNNITHTPFKTFKDLSESSLISYC